MKKIIGVLRPFDIQQTFYVYQDGNKIGSFHTTIPELDVDILKYAKQYDVDQVDFSGAAHYVSGLIQKIQKKEIEKYQYNKLIFNCI